MKILVAHNIYQRHGGEDSVVLAEVRLLEAHGHRVMRYQRHNDELIGCGALGAISAGIETMWASKSLREMKEMIADERPDVAHFHNTLPLISPSAYYACADAGIPVIQTLHNYRLLCPGAAFLREGRVCQECLGRSVAWPGIAHRCYRGSRSATGAIAAMLTAHHMMGTWRKKVTAYIALSEFARDKFIEGGLPAERIAVKPNFVDPDPGPKQGPGDYALFVGRLSEEKGLRVLLDAWSRLQVNIPLQIAGDGPLQNEIDSRIAEKKLTGITLLGPLTKAQVLRAMHGARFLVFPSVWFEGFPVSLVEAFACGLPVIASQLGSLLEIVADGVTGLHFSAGDPRQLAAKAEWAWTHPADLEILGRNARAEYESKYTAEKNYQYLVGLWDRLGIDCRK